MADALATHRVRAGHEVFVGGRDEQKAQRLATRIGGCRATGVCSGRRTRRGAPGRAAIRLGGRRRQRTPDGAEREGPARLCHSGRARLPAADRRWPLGSGPTCRGGTGCAGRQGVHPLPRGCVAD
ncbi:hypothetical protein [Streptomyces sp. QHH-9511]|uniref:hypothetical protein n=1 Tax=Streptomyces sp. QHH-9511 TaxID=2684468 RepID=UPI003FCCA37B